MKHLLAPLLLTSVLAAPAFADDRLPHTPRAGLWEATVDMSVDGVPFDPLEALRGAREQLLQYLPPEQQAALSAALGEQGQAPRVCLTKDNVANANTVEYWLEEFESEMDGCTFTSAGRNGATLKVTGQCDGQSGFKGQLDGTLNMPDDRSVNTVLQGKGEVRLEALGMPGASSGLRQYRIAVNSRFVQQDCAGVPALN
ncbi:DUF3617 domain-containing protein [Isoalcanivorax beigongshangi]|uniref:DUF3617 domain-containing protein n=1 Tax=Isoalcanivorax beigongshangi TaxID=3238810 RepID=A0ABV4ADS2_9GAMM